MQRLKLIMNQMDIDVVLGYRFCSIMLNNVERSRPIASYLQEKVIFQTLLKTYAANSHAHHSCVRYYSSCRSTIYEFWSIVVKYSFLAHLSLKTSCSIGKTPCRIPLSHPRDLLIPSTWPAYPIHVTSNYNNLGCVQSNLRLNIM